MLLGKKHRQRGFGYMTILLIAAALGIVAGTTYQQQSLIQQRIREADWRYVGQQYQQAITSYYRQSPNGLTSLPKSIDDLLRDSRFLQAKHHLRKPYLDPFTNQPWRLIKTEAGEIIGVSSQSDLPILQLKPLQAIIKLDSEVTQYAQVNFSMNAAELQKQAQQKNAAFNQETDNNQSAPEEE